MNLEITAIISREDGGPVTEADAEAITHGFIDWCEANGFYMFSTSKMIDDEGETITDLGVTSG